MLTALLVFLVGCLVLAVVLYVFSLVLPMCKLPEPVNTIATIIVGLIGLILLITLVVSVYSSRTSVIDIFR